MLTSRSAFQPGEYSATWKHTAQGPLTVRLNHVSETDMNHSNCSVTINCASQKGRHFSEKLFIVLLSARFLVIQSIRRVYHSFVEELPQSPSTHFFHEGSPQHETALGSGATFCPHWTPGTCAAITKSFPSPQGWARPAKKAGACKGSLEDGKI